MNSPLRWHGGKFYLADQIVKMMPSHTRYVEPFAGGLNVLLRKPFEGISEYANDLNGELMNFWRVLRNEFHFERLQKWLHMTPLNMADFDDVTAPSSLTEEQQKMQPCEYRAYWFFIRARMSRQGLGKDFCTPTSRPRRGMNEQVSAWLSAIEGLPDVHNRLKRVEIWNLPAVEVIRKLDSESTLFYLDPPYLHSTRSSVGEYGQFEMKEADHIALLDCLSSIKGMFLLSGYDSPLYRSYKQKHFWSSRYFDLPNNASSAKSKERKTELIWSNF